MKTEKKPCLLYLEKKIITALKEKKINISKEVNNFLAHLFSQLESEKEIETLQKEIQTKKIELTVLERQLFEKKQKLQKLQEEETLKEIQKLSAMYWEKIREGKFSETKKIIDFVEKKFNLPRNIAMKAIETGKIFNNQ